MENADRELIKRIIPSNHELNRLYSAHQVLSDKVERFENRPFLTTIEEVELKRLKFEKLRGVDRMMNIVGIRR